MWDEVQYELTQQICAGRMLLGAGRVQPGPSAPSVAHSAACPGKCDAATDSQAAQGGAESSWAQTMFQLGGGGTQLQGGPGKLHGSWMTDCLAQADADPLSGGDVAVRRRHLPACIQNKDANPMLYELEQR